MAWVGCFRLEWVLLLFFFPLYIRWPFFFSNERIGVINVYFHHPGLSLAAFFAGGGKVIRAAGFSVLI